VIERLAPERDVVAIDLPGFGESPPLPDGAEPTPQALAGAVVAFLDELGLDRPVVAGNSLGGWIGLELARRGRARAVAPIDPAGFQLPRERAYSTRRLWVEVRGARLIAAHAPWVARNPFTRTLTFAGMMTKPWRVPADTAVAMVRNLASSPGFDATLEVLGRSTFAAGEEIRVPVTLMWGSLDALLIPRQAERAARVLPTARLVWLRGAGHVPPWDAPDEIADELLKL
jgi:pimeloyl-ACP methyl ester carboxylesterase